MKKILFASTGILCCAMLHSQKTVERNFSMPLHTDWQMQSSLAFQPNGKEISQANYKTKGWYNISVPTTIIGGLLQNKVYAFDPFYGQNFEKISGEKFDKSWWFRKEFKLPAEENNKTVILKLQGINYKANVWVNGKLIADSTQIKGPFRIYELDITNQIKYNEPNEVALEITRPFTPDKEDGDLAVDYADWIHYPADYNGGIINNASIETCDKVEIRYPLVTTKFDLPSLSVAHLSVDGEVVNYSNEAQDVVVEGSINSEINFQQSLHLLPNETKKVFFSSAKYPQLNIKDPRIWWPWQYGKPELNRIKISVKRNNKTSSEWEENFGIRQITSKLINKRSREFIINGKPIMLRGAAWSPDIFQRRSSERQEDEIKLVRDMHMNIVRSEGKMEDDNFYDLCDKYGLLVMTGWMCCGAWQYPENWTPAERNVAMQSAKSIMYWLRNKACILTWLNGSDMAASDTSVERDYLKIEANLKFPNPVVSSASADVSTVSGPSGVKMNGPYDWVPPAYWENDSDSYGGAWSFATEISPGPSIPPYESLIKFIPQDSLSNINSDWLYHCGTMQFGNTHIFDSALSERYGQPASFKEYLMKAQAQNYEGERAMMEGYGLNKYNTATGVVQWMLCNPWPSLIWHTYDYYLYPGGSYFGMKKSLEPLHIQYSYKSREVIITNYLLQNFSGLKAEAEIFNLDGALKFSKVISADVTSDGVKRCFQLPDNPGLSATYFLRLQLNDENGKPQSINWYWLSKKADKLNWDSSKWYYTPQSSFTDYSTLKDIPPASLEINNNTAEKDGKTFNKITVVNKGKTVAFMIHLRALKNKNGDDILPVFFDDNYFSLAPGESRTIECSYESRHNLHMQPFISASAWNLNIKDSKAGANAGFADEAR